MVLISLVCFNSSQVVLQMFKKVKMSNSCTFLSTTFRPCLLKNTLLSAPPHKANMIFVSRFKPRAESFLFLLILQEGRQTEMDCSP